MPAGARRFISTMLRLPQRFTSLTLPRLSATTPRHAAAGDGILSPNIELLAIFLKLR